MTEQLRNKLATTRAKSVERADDAPPAMSTSAVVKQMIERQTTAFRDVLPRDVDSARYARLVMVAVKANPKLLDAFATPSGQTSVLLAAMQAAALGLEPNTPTQECWILPRNRKVKDENNRDVWIAEAELSIGYRGFVKKVRETGKVTSIFAAVVRKGDHFRWSRGLLEDTFEHEVADEQTADDGDEAAMTHAYAVVRYKGGGYDFVVLNRRQIHKRRAMSDSWKADQKYNSARSPWTNWPEEQWQKTAIRTLVKLLDLSREVDAAVYSDGARLALTDEGTVTALPYEDTAGEIGPAPEPEPAAPEPEPDRRPKAGPPANVDPATGEIDPFDAEPEHVEATATEQPKTSEPAKAWTPAQSRKIFALLAQNNIKSDDDRLEYASATLGRTVESFSTLTRQDAARMIDALEAL